MSGTGVSVSSLVVTGRETKALGNKIKILIPFGGVRNCNWSNSKEYQKIPEIKKYVYLCMNIQSMHFQQTPENYFSGHSRCNDSEHSPKLFWV